MTQPRSPKIERSGGFLCDIYHQLLKGKGEGEPCDIGKYVYTSRERPNPQLKKRKKSNSFFARPSQLNELRKRKASKQTFDELNKKVMNVRNSSQGLKYTLFSLHPSLTIDDCSRWCFFREIKQCFEHKDCGAGQKCINQVQIKSMLSWSLEYQRKCLILKGLASHCSAKTTFTFHFSIINA